jgi:hypothetical protein
MNKTVVWKGQLYLPAPPSTSTATRLPENLGRTPSTTATASVQVSANLRHPGTKATVKLVSQRFVWPGIQTDFRA